MNESARQVDQIDEPEKTPLVVENSGAAVDAAVGRTVSPRRNKVLDAATIKADVLAERPPMPKKPTYPTMMGNDGKIELFEAAVKRYWKEMAKYEEAKKAYEAELAYVDAVRPKTRGDCENGIRPCPHVSCKHNLYLDVKDGGNIIMNFPELEPDEMDPELSCALDVAGREGLTLEEIAAALNVTRTAVQSIETLSIGKLQDEMAKPSKKSSR